MASKDEIFEQLLLLGFEFEVAVLVIEDSTVSTVEAAIDKAIILQQTQTQTAQVTPPTKSVSSGDVLNSMIQEQNLNPSIQAISHDSTDHDYVFVDSTQSPLQETRSVPVNTNQPIVSQQPKAEIHISRISQPYFHRSLGSLAVLPGVEQIVKSKLANEPSTSQGDSTSVVSASTADTERFSSKPTYLGHSMKETLRGRHYFAVPRASFQTDVSDMAFRVQKALNISSLDALCIISKESYRVDQICYEAEKDPKGYLARYGLCALEPEGPVEVEPNTCFICLRQNPEELIQHECGNRACTDCWLSLVTSSLDADSSLPICCHPACHRFLQPAFCQAFVNPAQAHELENKYMRAFKKAGFPVRSCPNPSCEIVIIGQNIDEIKCDCGFCGCLQCGASPGHGLMTCKSFAEWNDMMREGQKKSEAIIKSRQCPRCSAPQVKSKISSWMTCFQWYGSFVVPLQ
eukprot:TRINITY_DN888_c0_g1_i5.p1 TRINITY_DN888_c0_g1~~TRINITY_DN888_c0_g1_i5.p1  ORF type:complete len:460 (+),score=81.39 TRINITY_DN888_c0_g1_i5:45-1424(+)